jgi:hypothetical protein
MWCVRGTYWFNLQEWLLGPPLKNLEPITLQGITFQNIWMLINTENLKSHTVVLFCITCFMLDCFNFTLYLTANTFFLSFKNCFSPRLHSSYRTHNLVTIVGMTTTMQLTQPLTRVPTLLEKSSGTCSCVWTPGATTAPTAFPKRT